MSPRACFATLKPIVSWSHKAAMRNNLQKNAEYLGVVPSHILNTFSISKISGIEKHANDKKQYLQACSDR